MANAAAVVARAKRRQHGTSEAERQAERDNAGQHDRHARVAAQIRDVRIGFIRNAADKKTPRIVIETYYTRTGVAKPRDEEMGNSMHSYVAQNRADESRISVSGENEDDPQGDTPCGDVETAGMTPRGGGEDAQRASSEAAVVHGCEPFGPEQGPIRPRSATVADRRPERLGSDTDMGAEATPVKRGRTATHEAMVGAADQSPARQVRVNTLQKSVVAYGRDLGHLFAPLTSDSSERKPRQARSATRRRNPRKGEQAAHTGDTSSEQTATT